MQVTYEHDFIVISQPGKKIKLNISEARLALENICDYCDTGDFYSNMAIADMVRTNLDRMLQDYELRALRNGSIYAAYTRC